MFYLLNTGIEIQKQLIISISLYIYSALLEHMPYIICFTWCGLLSPLSSTDLKTLPSICSDIYFIDINIFNITCLSNFKTEFEFPEKSRRWVIDCDLLSWVICWGVEAIGVARQQFYPKLVRECFWLMFIVGNKVETGLTLFFNQN